MDIQATGNIKRDAKKSQHDKRSDFRHTLELDTEIHFREQALKGMFRCCTSNIGLQGAFFSAKNLPITDKTEIDLVFSARTKSSARTKPIVNEYRLPAKLVRIQGDGAAVVFCTSDEGERQDFRRFLFKAKVAARK